MTGNNWRDTLYIWDGIVSVGGITSTSTTDADADADDTAKENSTPTKNSQNPLSWEGRWVPVTNVPDATKADVPKRNAFKEFVDSDYKFTVSGTATPTGEQEAEDNENEKEDEHFFIAKLTEGDGWDIEDDDEDDDADDDKKKKKYQDGTHDVLVKKLRWSGNDCDQSEYLIVAKGMNEFGPFISVGWQRPGCRWTLARRYLQVSSSFDDDTDDPRIYWSLMELYRAVLKESIEHMESTGQKRLKIPPWQSSIMHVKYQQQEQPDHSNGDGGGKRQKTTKKTDQ